MKVPFQEIRNKNLLMFTRVAKRFLWEKLLYAVLIPLPLIVAAAHPAMASEVLPTGVHAEGNGHVMLLVFYVFLALFFSFLCSVAEAVLLSLTPSYIEDQKSKNPKLAELLISLKLENVDRSLAAILTLNTFAHTIGAIGAGAQASFVFGSAWFGVFSAVMTLMILFLSEIVPKTLGAIYWAKLVRPTAFFVNALVWLLYPIVWVSERLTQFISRGKNVHIFSRDEFIAMASLGVQTGQIHSKESKVIHNLLRFESLKVADIMTPRTVISALPEEMALADSITQVSQISFSRIPLYGSNIDEITGFILKNDVLISATHNRGDEKLLALKREIIAVPMSISLTALLDLFLKKRQHIALVVNEYGGTAGLVTLEDMIETLMGMEIMDETDTVEDMRVLARKQWMNRAKAMGIEPEVVDSLSAEQLSTREKSQPRS
ncbi:MAG: hemolysin family protein [Desulforhopalus sp.]|nr:hemolysin family protein [Desulforhopalus sp.]